jgi:hypothetical protein
MLQIYKKPSLAVPRLAKYFESGLKATQRTPKVWSGRDVKGVSDGASGAVENISTRGL